MRGVGVGGVGEEGNFSFPFLPFYLFDSVLEKKKRK